MSHDHSWVTVGVDVSNEQLRPNAMLLTVTIVQTCECGEARYLNPPRGYTPDQEWAQAQTQARREERRAKQREYNRRAKERKEAEA